MKNQQDFFVKNSLLNGKNNMSKCVNTNLEFLQHVLTLKNIVISFLLMSVITILFVFIVKWLYDRSIKKREKYLKDCLERLNSNIDKVL